MATEYTGEVIPDAAGPAEYTGEVIPDAPIAGLPSTKYSDTVDEQSFLQNALAGAGGSVAGLGISLRQLLGRDVPEDEVREYQHAMSALRGSAGGIVGEAATWLAPSSGMLKAAGKVPALARLLAQGGAKALAVVAGAEGLTGAIQGGVASPVNADESRLLEAGKGGLAGVGGTYLGAGIARTGSKVMDVFRPWMGKMGLDTAAGKMMNTAAGESAEQVQRRLASAGTQRTFSAPTAQQVLTDTGNPNAVALMTIANRTNSAPFASRGTEQAMERADILRTFAGSDASIDALKTLRGAEFSAAVPNIEAATASQLAGRSTTTPGVLGVPVTTLKGSHPAIEALKKGENFQDFVTLARQRVAKNVGLPDEVGRLTDAERLDIIKDPTKSFKGMQLIKFYMNDALGSRGVAESPYKPILAKMTDQEIGALRKSFMEAAYDAAPGWRESDAQFAKRSGELFQEKAGQSLLGKLQKPLAGQESPGAIAQSLRQETSLIRGSGGNVNKALDEQLTPENLRKVRQVVSQLDVNANIDSLSKNLDTARLQKIIGPGINIPNLMREDVAVVRSLFSKTIGTGTIKTLEQLAELGNNPAVMAAAMAKASAVEKRALRNAVAAGFIGGEIGRNYEQQQ